MLEKRKCQRARFPNPRHTPANCIEDFAKVLGAAIGEFLSFDIAPESLYGIQSGSVTRPPLHALGRRAFFYSGLFLRHPELDCLRIALPGPLGWSL